MSDLIHSNKQHRIFINSEFADNNTNFSYSINPPLIGCTQFKINQIAIPIDSHTFSGLSVDDRTIQINIDEGSNQNQLIAVVYSDTKNYTLDTLVQEFAEASPTTEVAMLKSAKNGCLTFVNRTTNHLKLVRFPSRLTDKLNLPAQIDAAHHFLSPESDDSFVVAFENTDTIWDVDHFLLTAEKDIPGQPSVVNKQSSQKAGVPLYTVAQWESFFNSSNYNNLADPDLRLNAGNPTTVVNLGGGNYRVNFTPIVQQSIYTRQWRLQSFDREGNEVRDLSGLQGTEVIIPANTVAGSIEFSATFKLEEKRHANYYGTHDIGTFLKSRQYTISEIVNVINTGLSTLALTYPSLGFSCSNSGNRLVFSNTNTANFTTAYGKFTVLANPPIGLPNNLDIGTNETIQAPNEYFATSQDATYVTPILDTENLNRISYLAIPNLVSSSRCGLGHRSFVKSILNSSNTSFGGYAHMVMDNDAPFTIGNGTNIIDKIQVEIHDANHTIKRDTGLPIYLEVDFF
jgi:hypothetical protein